MDHEEELRTVAIRILEVARKNCERAHNDLQELEALVESQKLRIRSLDAVISDLEKYENK